MATLFPGADNGSVLLSDEVWVCSVSRLDLDLLIFCKITSHDTRKTGSSPAMKWVQPVVLVLVAVYVYLRK